MIRIAILLAVALSLVANLSQAAPRITVPENTKLTVHEIITSSGKLGTGVIILENDSTAFLVTCAHVLTDPKTGQMADSLFLRLNRRLKDQRAVSDTAYLTVRLGGRHSRYVTTHPNSNIDLVAIGLANSNTAKPAKGLELRGLYLRNIPDKSSFDSLFVDDGTDVVIVGFAISNELFPQNVLHYHFARFGRVGSYSDEDKTLLIDSTRVTAKFMLLDISIRPGDSGSPVFGILEDKWQFLGIANAAAGSAELGIGYPSFYLRELVEAAVKANAVR